MVFLLTCLAIYYIMPVKIRWVLLLLASIGYYMSFIPVFIIPVLVIVIINYFLTTKMAPMMESRSKYYIALGIAFNMIILTFYHTSTTITVLTWHICCPITGKTARCYKMLHRKSNNYWILLEKVEHYSYFLQNIKELQKSCNET